MTSGTNTKREIILKVRFNQTEFERLKELACERKLSAFIRGEIFRQHEIQNKKVSNKTDPEINASRTRQIAWAGSNINQIAKAMNFYLKKHPEKDFDVLSVALLLNLLWKKLNDPQSV